MQMTNDTYFCRNRVDVEDLEELFRCKILSPQHAYEVVFVMLESSRVPFKKLVGVSTS